MKQKLMFCLLLAGSFCLTANAQIQKGKWIGGLTLDGRKYKSDSYMSDNGIRVYNGEYVESRFNSSIIINRMLSKKWMLGAGLDYNRL